MRMGQWVGCWWPDGNSTEIAGKANQPAAGMRNAGGVH